MFSSNKSEGQYHLKESQRLTPVEGLILLAALVLMALPAWVRGGTIRKYLTFYPCLAGVTIFIFLLVPYLRRTSHSKGCSLVREQIQCIFRDPIFYLGAAFLCQLYIQWRNSGKVRILVQGLENVTFCSPYIDWLPGAVSIIRSWDMIVWLFPAFVALLLIRHGFSKPQMVEILFWGMIINASLLAIFGLIAPLLVNNYPLWLTPLLPRGKVLFFSTFGYPNHAGSFLHIASGLSIRPVFLLLRE